MQGPAAATTLPPGAGHGAGIALTVGSQEMPEPHFCASQDAAVDPPQPVVAARLGFLERDNRGAEDPWRWLLRMLVAAFDHLRRTFPEPWKNPPRTGLFINLPLPRPGLSQELAKPPDRLVWLHSSWAGLQ